jgi:predicted Zn-ribbon and HTH transcriptional regulator
MSPVDPNLLQPYDEPAATAMTDTPRPCANCGYDLRGLPQSGTCPECGQPIVQVRGVRMKEPPLGHAPRSYLALLSLGLVLMACGWVARWAGLLLPPVLGMGATGSALSGAMGLGLWLTGLGIVLRPRPIGSNDGSIFGREWLRLRLLIALTQCAGLASVAATAALGGGGAASVFGLILFFSETIVAMGWIPLCIYLARIADWAPEDGLARRLRGTGFCLGFFGVMIAAMFLPNWPVLGVIRGIVTFLAGAWFFGIFLSTVALLIWMVQMISMVTWAMRNAANERARDRRRAQRARGEMVEEDQFCPYCRYDLAGLPVGPGRCPECGEGVTVLGASAWRGSANPEVLGSPAPDEALLASIEDGHQRSLADEQDASRPKAGERTTIRIERADDTFSLEDDDAETR